MVDGQANSAVDAVFERAAVNSRIEARQLVPAGSGVVVCRYDQTSTKRPSGRANALFPLSGDALSTTNFRLKSA